MFAVCLALSLAAHALVLVFGRGSGAAMPHSAPHRLEVALLKVQAPTRPAVAAPARPRHARREPARVVHLPVASAHARRARPVSHLAAAAAAPSPVALPVAARPALHRTAAAAPPGEGPPHAAPAPSRPPPVAAAGVPTDRLTRGPVRPTPPSFSAAYLHNPPPAYPLVARRQGDQGTVTLRVFVTPRGMPGRVTVDRSSGSIALDAAAVAAVKAWRFVPAQRAGHAVDAWVLVPIVFHLRDAS